MGRRSEYAEAAKAVQGFYGESAKSDFLEWVKHEMEDAIWNAIESPNADAREVARGESIAYKKILGLFDWEDPSKSINREDH